MAELRSLLEGMGLMEVRTYIQSGNAVFTTQRLDAPVMAGEIAGEIERHHGFAPRIMLLTPEDLRDAMNRNPYADGDPKRVHFYFLADPPHKPDLARLEELAANGEAFTLPKHSGHFRPVFYLHAPEGIGKSKLAARVEGALGVAATARNLNTVQAILKMV